MTEPDRKSAAASFRRHIERSNELHAEYQDDPDLFADYDRFTRWQLDYLLPPNTRAMRSRICSRK